MSQLVSASLQAVATHSGRSKPLITSFPRSWLTNGLRRKLDLTSLDLSLLEHYPLLHSSSLLKVLPQYAECCSLDCICQQPCLKAPAKKSREAVFLHNEFDNIHVGQFLFLVQPGGLFGGLDDSKAV